MTAVAANQVRGTMTSDYYAYMTSHRKRHDGTRSWWIAVALTAVAAVSVVVAGWRLMPAPPAGPPRPARLAAVSGTGGGALLSELHLVSGTPMASGLLPPASCEPDSPSTVTCVAPATGITGVVFSTYPTLRALSAAYVARVRSLNAGQFTENYPGCGRPGPAGTGEGSWSDQSWQPRPGTGARGPAGVAAGGPAAGRVFCTMTVGAREDMVWTQDDGRLLGWVAGDSHQDVWAWWAAIRGEITFPG